MDAISLAEYINKTIRFRREQVHEILNSGGIKNMEHYASCMGNLDALAHVEQELKGLLKKQEQLDD